MKFGLLTYAIWWALVYSGGQVTITILISEHFHHPKKNALYSRLSSPQPLIDFCSLWIYLLWAFHIHGIRLPVAFGISLLSLSIIFQGPFTSSMCQSFILLYWGTIFRCANRPHFVYPFIR